MKKHLAFPLTAIIMSALIMTAACSPAGLGSSKSETATDADGNTIHTKDFGTYTVPAGWEESSSLSSKNKWFYIKEGMKVDNKNPRSNISVEVGTNKYASEDHESFREAILNQLSLQISKKPTVTEVNGDGTYTENDYVLYIFTIEEESLHITTRQYYIVGNYRYVLVHETDLHDAEIPDVTDTARTIVDSFVGA